MKLLPESPIAFLESCSRLPETVYAAEVSGMLGTVLVAGTEHALLASLIDTPVDRFLGWLHDEWDVRAVFDEGPFGSVLDDFRAFLDGEPRIIHATVQPVGIPPFVLNIHETIARIPFGETVTYGELALLAGHPGAARAAGSACRRNRVLLAIPCHRVVAANGLGGFGGNLPLKRRLLANEQSIPAPGAPR